MKYPEGANTILCRMSQCHAMQNESIACQASLQECSILTSLASAEVQHVFGIETALRCHRLRAWDNRESATGEQQG